MIQQISVVRSVRLIQWDLNDELDFDLVVYYHSIDYYYDYFVGNNYHYLVVVVVVDYLLD
jgi:hypothetical protein